MKIIHILHTLAAIGLALFFLYSGSKKFIPKAPASKDPVAMEKAMLKREKAAESVLSETYASPESFTVTMKAMSKSGYLKMVGVFQILASLLILLKPTRLIGCLVLLPVIFNIFFLHVFMDNRPGELIETGALLLLNILLILFYKNKFIHALDSVSSSVVNKQVIEA